MENPCTRNSILQCTHFQRRYRKSTSLGFEGQPTSNLGTIGILRLFVQSIFLSIKQFDLRLR